MWEGRSAFATMRCANRVRVAARNEVERFPKGNSRACCAPPTVLNAIWKAKIDQIITTNNEFSKPILFQTAIYSYYFINSCCSKWHLRPWEGAQRALEFPFGKRSTSLRAAALTRFTPAGSRIPLRGTLRFTSRRRFQPVHTASS